MRSRLDDERQAVQLILSGQKGYFDYRVEPRRPLYETSIASLVARVGQFNYFAPIPRQRRRSRADDVAQSGNVLWADVDLPKNTGPTAARKAQLTADTIARLADIGIVATVVIDSAGGGIWIFLKLPIHIPIEKLEELNKRLARFLDADSAWNRSRIARAPGGVNHKTGRRATVVHLSGVLADPDGLDSTLPALLRRRPRGKNPPSPVRASHLRRPRLPARLWAYIHEKPCHGWHNARYSSRSEAEYAIFLSLAAQGFTDAEILALADSWALPRHSEEHERRHNVGWTLHSISKARQALAETGHAPHLPKTRKPRVDRRAILQSGIIRGQPIERAKEEIMKDTGCSRRTAHNVLQQLIAAGYARVGAQREDRRVKRVFLTTKFDRLQGDSQLRRSIRLSRIRNLTDGSEDKRSVW